MQPGVSSATKKISIRTKESTMCKFCNDTSKQYTEEVYEPTINRMIISVDMGVVSTVEGGPAYLDIEVWDFDIEADGNSIDVDGKRFKREVIREDGHSH